MGIKRIVDTDFWTDDKVMEMFTPEDKLFFLYLLTNPHCTPLGVYKILPKQIAFELGYSVESVNALIDRFQSKYRIILYSGNTKEIAIKNYLRYGIVSGGKPIKDRLTADVKSVKDKSLLRFISCSMEDSEPENQTVREFLQWMKVFLKTDSNGDGFGYGDGNGDGDGDSYHESYNESYNESSGSSKKSAKYDYDSFKETYNSVCKDLRSCKAITDKRKKAIKTFLKDFTVEQWREICELANKSEFLKGNNDRKWKADIDFLLRTDKAAKILEGGYQNKNGNYTSSSTPKKEATVWGDVM